MDGDVKKAVDKTIHTIIFIYNVIASFVARTISKLNEIKKKNFYNYTLRTKMCIG